jgi:two-component system, NtrC family, response regulator AtoC
MIQPFAPETSPFYGLVGASPVMRELYERINAVASTRSTVLIIGESGTGKELVARAIHSCSSSPESPFVAFNCAAIPRELIESELFGYKRGAFSGANMEYLGLFRAAEGGTVFLDEITEMSPETQSKLLRALQERTVRPVGSPREVPVDVRIIASTNRDPQKAVKSGQLRDDLSYRLLVNVLDVPPLRDRREDIPLLIDHFITLFNSKLGRHEQITDVDPEARVALESHDWPGNVRELANAIESAFTFCRSKTIALTDLPPAVARLRPLRPLPPALQTRGGVIRTLAEVERDLIRQALLSTDGNKAQAARLLGISRKKLYAKIDKYGLEPRDEPRFDTNESHRDAPANCH